MSTHSWIHMGMARFTSAEIGSGGMEWPAMSSGWLFWWIEGWQSKAMHGEAYGNTLHCRTSSSLSSSTTSPVAAKTTPFTPQCTNTPYSWTNTCSPNKSTTCHHSNTKAKTTSKHLYKANIYSRQIALMIETYKNWTYIYIHIYKDM